MKWIMNFQPPSDKYLIPVEYNVVNFSVMFDKMNLQPISDELRQFLHVPLIGLRE